MNSIDQRTKNLDEGAALPSAINQQQTEKKKTKNSSLGIVKEKEEQGKVSAREEEEEEAEEKGGPQAETRKNQRGKYRQYEDSQVVVEKIRSYRTQRYPDSEIMKLLDDMPRRTYYNYVKKLQEQDKQIMEQWISENVEHYAEDLMIYREHYARSLERFKELLTIKTRHQKIRCKL